MFAALSGQAEFQDITSSALASTTSPLRASAPGTLCCYTSYIGHYYAITETSKKALPVILSPANILLLSVPFHGRDKLQLASESKTGIYIYIYSTYYMSQSVIW